ncbi:MAG: ORF6N domain-containing protein [Saprospiraceae bacterium]|nr:ORF6N domain-containing protein [Saprospiraceae bacterium]
MEIQIIQTKIHLLRGERIMFDFDLAELYAVTTRRLKEAVRRNIERFPHEFMFELTQEEFKNLRSQFATSSWGGTRYPPFAFTEHGVAMLSSVLNSQKAIQTNIAIVKAFIALRQYALTYTELAQTITDLEARFAKEFADINEVLHWLGEENKARHDENQALQKRDITPGEWAERARIGFRKDV